MLSIDIKLREFEGPMDLLFHLIEKNDIDIYDIPISELTKQYMDYLENMKKLDMALASDFLLMGATLVHIKSKMMLPTRACISEDIEEDPREELVLSLLRYKRCKMLSETLKQTHEVYKNCYYRKPMTAKELDIEIKNEDKADFNPFLMEEAIAAVNDRNMIRFQDISAKITHILKKDKLTIKEVMSGILNKLRSRKRIFFHELFKDTTSPMNRIVNFLSVLELLRGDKIIANQNKPFDVILLEKKEE